MKTIGQILKDARIKKKYSLNRVEEITKIKKQFIDLIEKQRWSSLPPFPTVFGFVSSLSTSLGIDEKMAVAVLRRDYPPKKLSINPKPDMASKFSWNPKLTFAIGIATVLILIFGYLGFIYTKFISSPDLKIESPKEGQIVSGREVLVFGSTGSDAKIEVNNQPVLVDENGKFSVNIEVTAETKEIVVRAISRSGKTTEIKRTVKVE